MTCFFSGANPFIDVPHSMNSEESLYTSGSSSSINNNNNNNNNKMRYSPNEDQTYKGELTGVNMYNYAMCSDCFRLIADPCISNMMRGNVLAWPPTDMDPNGDVEFVQGNACRD